MKISQDVREFAKSERAKKLETAGGQKSDPALSSASMSEQEASTGSNQKMSEAEAQKGMDEMSEKFKELGSEIYHKVS